MVNYAKGDVLDVEQRPVVIAHVCNDAGGWGRGFVVNLSKKWKQPEDAYRKWASREPGSMPLGDLQIIKVDDRGVWVANMVAQHGWGSQKKQWIDYEALRRCLTTLAGCIFSDPTKEDPFARASPPSDRDAEDRCRSWWRRLVGNRKDHRRDIG